MNPSDVSPSSPKSRKVYIVLAALLGTAGIHNFYARRWWPGAIQFVLGGFSLWVGWVGFKHLLNLLGNGLPDAGDPEAMEALQQTLIQGATGGSWIDIASTVAFVAVAVWVLIDIFGVKRDGAGNPMA